VSSAAERVPESLLIVRLGAMGDVIHTLPAVAALRAHFPHARIGWIIEERWAELLCARNAPRLGPRNPSRPIVDFVHAVDTKRWRKSLLSRDTQRQISKALGEVRQQKYEVAVDFQGALKSAVISLCSGAETIVGMQHPRESPARVFYQHRIETKGAHVIEQYHSLAEGVAGSDLKMPPVEFPFDPIAEDVITPKVADSAGRFAIMNPGAGWAAKQWPPEQYGEVAKALAQNGVLSFINYSHEEEALAQRVQEASGNIAKLISCSIGELIALTRRAKLFIGGDTGPLHLAAALKVPVVAIFGPTDPARNGPFGTRSVVLRNPASRTSLSHTSKPDPGLLQITAEEVITAARNLLGSADA
jgi:heptosyltransferase-1